MEQLFSRKFITISVLHVNLEVCVKKKIAKRILSVFIENRVRI